ncbi:MAG: hypothetical protein FWD31_02530 [Planctomycetaceae bacterium]|nr:hypothetical protein [Planctomycetaceae bacterium]
MPNETKLAINSGVPASISQVAVEMGGLKSYPAKVVLSTGKPVYNRSMGGWFVIDLDTVQLKNTKIIGDYNHNDDEVIGHAEQWEVTDEGLVVQALIAPFKEDDRASEILARSKSGTPYEASPTVAAEEATIDTLSEGETAVVNGREVRGNIRIYRNLPILGFSICPYGTDKQTKVTILKNERETMNEEDKPQDPTTDGGGDGGGDGGSQYTAVPELETMIEEYGLEYGVDFYRRGLSVEEAKDEFIKIMKDEVAQLKATPKTLSADDPPKTDDNADPPAGNDDETKKLRADLTTLQANYTKLSAELTKLKMGQGEKEPLSIGKETDPPQRDAPQAKVDPIRQFAEHFEKNRK